jgi:hypothetical protein
VLLADTTNAPAGFGQPGNGFFGKDHGIRLKSIDGTFEMPADKLCGLTLFGLAPWAAPKNSALSSVHRIARFLIGRTVHPMKRSLTPVRALVLALCGAGSLAAASPTGAPASRPDRASTYTVTATLQVLQPFNPADMQDDFQEVRVVAQERDSCTVEITYYPLFEPAVGENARWREEYARMTEYLRPTPTENWDETLRRDLLVGLREAGIDPERLTDKQVVEQVSRWAMKRAKSTGAFAIWAVHFPAGQPEVFPPLRAAFDREKAKAGRTEVQMFEQEVLGRSMFYQKVHGSCTSTSVYLTTILRALGIPTRIVFCIPPFDPNDARQAEMFYEGIRHHRVRETVRSAIDGMTGFANHLFNEVYVGNRWVRLNYAKVGQPILDARYFGLLTHIFTCADLSQVPLAATWGLRYFRYRDAELKLTSVNPYRLIAVHDHFGPHARVDNPTVPLAQLRTATIVAVHRPDAPGLPRWVDRNALLKQGSDLLVAYREWIPGAYLQMRAFEKRVGHEFGLVAPGQPEIRASLSGLRLSQGDGTFQAYGLKIAPGDRAKVVSGVAYTLRPINTNDTYTWQLAARVDPVILRE